MCSICTKMPLSALDDLQAKAVLAEVAAAMKELSHKRKHDSARTHLESIIGKVLGIEDKDRDLSVERVFEERKRR